MAVSSPLISYSSLGPRPEIVALTVPADGSGVGDGVTVGPPARLVLEPQAANTSTHSKITIRLIIRCLMSVTPCAWWHALCATVSLVRTLFKGHSPAEQYAEASVLDARAKAQV